MCGRGIVFIKHLKSIEICDVTCTSIVYVTLLHQAKCKKSERNGSKTNWLYANAIFPSNSMPMNIYKVGYALINDINRAHKLYLTRNFCDELQCDAAKVAAAASLSLHEIRFESIN